MTSTQDVKNPFEVVIPPSKRLTVYAYTEGSDEPHSVTWKHDMPELDFHKTREDDDLNILAGVACSCALVGRYLMGNFVPVNYHIRPEMIFAINTLTQYHFDRAMALRRRWVELRSRITYTKALNDGAPMHLYTDVKKTAAKCLDSYVTHIHYATETEHFHIWRVKGIREQNSKRYISRALYGKKGKKIFVSQNHIVDGVHDIAIGNPKRTNVMFFTRKFVTEKWLNNESKPQAKDLGKVWSSCQHPTYMPAEDRNDWLETLQHLDDHYEVETHKPMNDHREPFA